MTDPQKASHQEQLRAEVARFRADYREQLEQIEANLQAACYAACQAERADHDMAPVDRLVRRSYYLLARGLAHRAAGYLAEALALSARASDLARRLMAA